MSSFSPCTNIPSKVGRPTGRRIQIRVFPFALLSRKVASTFSSLIFQPRKYPAPAIQPPRIPPLSPCVPPPVTIPEPRAQRGRERERERSQHVRTLLLGWTRIETKNLEFSYLRPTAAPAWPATICIAYRFSVGAPLRCWCSLLCTRVTNRPLRGIPRIKQQKVANQCTRIIYRNLAPYAAYLLCLTATELSSWE